MIEWTSFLGDSSPELFITFVQASSSLSQNQLTLPKENSYRSSPEKDKDKIFR